MTSSSITPWPTPMTVAPSICPWCADRIDDRADVVRGDDATDVHRAGLRVDFDFGDLRADIRKLVG